VISGEVGALAGLHAEQPYYPQLQKFVHQLFLPTWKRLGWSSVRLRSISDLMI